MSFNADFVDAEKTVQVVGFGRRFLAYFLDGIILNLVTLCVIFGVILGGGAIAGQNKDAASAITILAQCLGFLIGVAYFVGFWATTGQTLGKMAMGIKVISTDGSPVSRGKAFLRYLGYIVSGLVLSLGFIWAAFDEKRQGWHDKIAGTYVVPKDTRFSAMDNVTFVPSDSGGAAAAVVVLVSIVPILLLVSIVVIAVLLLLGPVVGNVFSNIVINLEKTPTP